MPKLLALLVSERSIIDERSHQASLIHIADTLNVNAPELPPDDAAAYVGWSLFVMWHSDPAEFGKEFIQRLTLIGPNGERASPHDTPFKPESLIKSEVISFTHMPIGQAGVYYFEISIRPTEGDEEYRVVANYPMTVNHNIIPHASNATLTTEDSDPAIHSP